MTRHPDRFTRTSLGLALSLTWLIATVCGGAAALAADSDADIADVLDHYEQVRQPLVVDSLDGINEHAEQLTAALAALEADFDPARAGIDTSKPENADTAHDLLGAMLAAAQALVTASNAADLDATRNAFYELSKPLVRYRNLLDPDALGGATPVVAYCSMAKKSWLQPDGRLGNPYYGSVMPTCGEIVTR